MPPGLLTSGLRPRFVWNFLRERASIAEDIGAEVSALRAAGVAKPSSRVAPSDLVPEGFRVLSSVAGPGAQLSNTTGVLASTNMVSFTVENITTIIGAEPYLPGVRGDQP